jgi:hypothetical protein
VIEAAATAPSAIGIRSRFEMPIQQLPPYESGPRPFLRPCQIEPAASFTAC